MRVLEDEHGNRGVQCPGCGMYAFASGEHRAGFLEKLLTAFKYALGRRPPLPAGVRGVGWERHPSQD